MRKRVRLSPIFWGLIVAFLLCLPAGAAGAGRGLGFGLRLHGGYSDLVAATIVTLVVE